jgi:hypothetical protein
VKQKCSKGNKEMYLYRRVFDRDENDDEWDIDTSESSVESVSNSTLTSVHTLARNVDLQTLILEESVFCLLYQSPLQAVTVFCINPASILTFINCVTKISTVQLPYLTSIILDSDTTHPWQYQLSVNIRLIDNIRDVQVNESWISTHSDAIEAFF